MTSLSLAFCLTLLLFQVIPRKQRQPTLVQSSKSSSLLSPTVPSRSYQGGDLKVNVFDGKSLASTFQQDSIM